MANAIIFSPIKKCFSFMYAADSFWTLGPSFLTVYLPFALSVLLILPFLYMFCIYPSISFFLLWSSFLKFFLIFILFSSLRVLSLQNLLPSAFSAVFCPFQFFFYCMSCYMPFNVSLLSQTPGKPHHTLKISPPPQKMPPSLNVSLLGRQFPQTHAMFSHPRFSLLLSPFSLFIGRLAKAFSRGPLSLAGRKDASCFPLAGWKKECTLWPIGGAPTERDGGGFVTVLFSTEWGKSHLLFLLRI